VAGHTDTTAHHGPQSVTMASLGSQSLGGCRADANRNNRWRRPRPRGVHVPHRPRTGLSTSLRTQNARPDGLPGDWRRPKSRRPDSATSLRCVGPPSRWSPQEHAEQCPGPETRIREHTAPQWCCGRRRGQDNVVSRGVPAPRKSGDGDQFRRRGDLLLSPVVDGRGTPTSPDHHRSNLELPSWTAWLGGVVSSAPAADAPNIGSGPDRATVAS
jgi:hypothetical protein